MRPTLEVIMAKKKPPAAIESLNTVTRHAHSGAGPRKATDSRAREAAAENASDDEGRAERIRSFAERCAQGERGTSFPWNRASDETRQKYRQPGRPMVFSTPEELYEGILAYFEECDTHTTTVIVQNRTAGPVVVDQPDPKPKHIAELCTFLGISRQTFYRYQEEEHPYHVVADWFDQVSEQSWNEQLLNPKRVKAAQFILQTKHKYVVRKDITSEGKQLGNSLADLLAEIDGDGFNLPSGDGGE